MESWWRAFAHGWANESLLEERDETPDTETGPRQRGEQYPDRRRRARLPVVLVIALTCGLSLLGAGAALSAGSSPFSWSAPQSIDNQYPFADPFSVNSLSCATSSLCVGTTSSNPSEILRSTDPTGSSASDWSVLPTSLLAQNATGYALSGGSCVTAGSGPFCVAAGLDQDATANPGVALTSTDPTGTDWPSSQLSDEIFYGPSCARRSGTTDCIVGSFNDLFVSTTPDGGSTTWTEIMNPFPDSGVAGVACAENSDETMCAAVSSSGLFLSATNPSSKGSWDKGTATTKETDVTSLSCPSTSLCLVSGQADGGPVSTSSDPTAANNSQWSVQGASGLPNPAGRVDCSVDTSVDDGFICLAGESGSVLASTDDGATWSAQTIGGSIADTPQAFSCPTATLCFGGTAGGAVINSTTANNGASGAWSAPVPAAGGDTPVTLYPEGCASTSLCVAGDSEGRILSSGNPGGGSSTWSQGSVDPAHTISQVNCPSTGLCVATAYGNSAETTDVTESTNPRGGAGTWSSPSRLDANSDVLLLQCPSTSLCVGADQAGNILTSTNPGQGAWSSPDAVPGGGLGAAGQLQCPSTSLCVAIDSNTGQVTQTTSPSGGAGTWATPATLDNHESQMTALQCPSASRCVAADAAGYVFTTTNPSGGVSTWTQSQPETTSGIQHLQCPNTNLCVGVDFQARMLVSTDGGTTWSTPQSFDPGGVVISQLACQSSSLCLATDSQGQVLASTDPAGGASTWSAPDAVDPDSRSFTGIACPSATLCLLSNEAGHLVSGTASASPPPPPPRTTAPSVVATAAPSVSSSGAALSGSVVPEGLLTSAHFEVGLDPKYLGGGAVQYTIFTGSQSVGSDFAAHTVTASVSGLLPNALYHARLVASNADGTVDGRDVTFMTSKARAPGAPTLGKTADLYPISGLIFVKPPKGKTIHGVRAVTAAAAIPKGQGFIPLTQARQVPIGSEIDALRGTLQLKLATAKKRRTQAATVNGSVFSLAQNRRGHLKGLTTFALKENAFKGAPSYTACTTGKKTTRQPISPLAQIARLSSKVLQTLHASDHGGKFRTRGRYSAATVRGTDWFTEDRCDGTLTKVRRGRVSVQDFRTRKTILLKAGHSFLAKRF